MARQFFPGWRRQAHDPRDRFFFAREVVSVPDYCDVTPLMGRQRDQLNQGSCGPTSLSQVLTYQQRQQALPEDEASVHFIYWYTRFLMGTVNEDSGVDNRTLLKAVANYGFCPEQMDPYSDSLSAMKKRPTQVMDAAAAPNKITAYAAVVQSLSQMKGVLAGNEPFLFGFDVFDQLLSDEAGETGIVKTPSQTESSIGGHDICFVGYSDKDLLGNKPGNKWPAGHFKFRNSWGEEWGDKGFGYFPYGYATNKNLASDFWVVSSVPGTATPPPPPPPPVVSTKTFSFGYDPKTNVCTPVKVS